ncbi:unnamed protein product [Ascophyllum nodosum]
MCHDNLPPKLLRLFFEPKQEAAKASAVASIESGILTGQTESSTANAKDDQHPQRASCDPEIIRLRRELASMTKLNDMTKDESTRLSRKLGEVHNELIETNVTHTISKQELEGQLKSIAANLRAAEINLFRANKENNQLKREMRGAQDMLRQFQGEKVALNFLHEVASKTTGARPRNGLGQVNLDEILRLISEGSAKADTVIKGQYDLLSGAIERERRTQRELNQSKAGYEAMELEVQKLRGKLLKSRKEGQRLTEALSSVGHEVLVVSPDRPGIGLLAKGAQSIQSPKDFQGGDCILPRRPDGGARRPADVSLVANSTDIMHETRRSPPAKRRASAVEGNDWTLEAQGSQVFSSHSFLGSTTASTGRTSRQKPGKFIRSGFNAMGGRHNVRSASSDRFGLGFTQSLNAARPR